ncbi:MAG: sulfotransferase domain-containing protein [Acidobacteriota bacterium]
MSSTPTATDSDVPNLIHCSYHKCLTVYFGRVMKAVFERCLPWSAGYRHFNSHLDAFYEDFHRYRLASVNNRALDLSRLGSFRLSRFIRDPRDLVVSGYFYHRRGAEGWVVQKAPTESDWYFANGRLPDALRGSDLSFAEYLQEVPKEEGLLAELEFRAAHFESMAQWPASHPDIVTFRYEDVVADGPGVFRSLFEFYRLRPVERGLANFFARRYALGGRGADPHIRNPASGQWREHFTPRVRREFDTRYAGLVRQLGYSAD